MAGTVKITFSEVRKTAKDFRDGAEQVRELQARGTKWLDTLSSTFVGNRANKIRGQWDGAQNAIRQTAEIYEKMAGFLDDAANIFEQADQA